jgi:hypothetical protein
MTEKEMVMAPTWTMVARLPYQVLRLVPRVARQLSLLILTVVQPAHHLIRMILIPILILLELDTVLYQLSPFCFRTHVRLAGMCLVKAHVFARNFSRLKKTIGSLGPEGEHACDALSAAEK